jgi:hypothetical protein
MKRTINSGLQIYKAKQHQRLEQKSPQSNAAQSAAFFGGLSAEHFLFT